MSVTARRLLAAINNPKRAARYIRYERKRIMQRYSLDVNLGWLMPPQEVFLNVSSNCNFKCVMCDIGTRNAASNLGSKYHERKHQLSLQEWKRVIDRLVHIKPSIQLTAAEPLLYESFLPLVEYIKQKGLPLSITTNGWLLKQYLEALVKCNVEGIGISIDGFEETHDFMRGVKGSFSRILDCIDTFQSLRRKYPNSRTLLNSNTTITPYNYVEIKELYSLLSSKGIAQMGFGHLWFRTVESCIAHNRLFKDYVAMPTNLDVDIRDIPIEEVLAVIEFLETRRNVRLYPRFTREQLVEYYKSPNRRINGYCKVPWRQVDIMSDGEIILGTQCFATRNIGNILSDNLLELWRRSEVFRRLRKLLRENNGYLPGCSRCCCLYKYD